MRFVAYVNGNMPISQAAERLGMDFAAAQRFTRGDPKSSGHAVWQEMCAGHPYWESAKAQSLSKMAAPPPGMDAGLPDASGIRQIATLDGVVREALADGRHFRERYFGRRTVYWQDHLWDELWQRFEHGRATGERQYVVANMPPGGGKAGALHQVIPTPTGWTTFGDVAVGDEVVGPDGTPARVTFATEVMHGHDVYRVRFDDGAEVIVDGDHLWPVRSRDDRKRDRPARVLSTSELLRRGLTAERGKRLAWSVDLQVGLNLPEADLPIPPYVLGAWLGDGTAAGARITKPSPELWAQIEAEGMVSTPSANERAASLGTRGVVFADGRSLQTELRALGLLGCKHIPIRYLRANRQQMLDLLHGIMDTDGYVAPNGSASIDLCDERLARDVWHLLCAVGLKVAAPRPEPAKLYGRQTSTRWRMNFTAPFPLGRTSRITRHQRPARETTRRRYIEGIQPVPSVPVRCIQVDHPTHLFLVGHAFIPTHNTTLTHDFEARVIVEDRTIRIGNFSGASALAVRNTGRLRRTLERASPQLARQVDVDRGLAVNAVTSLAADFGAFRPTNRDVWRSEMFVVAQYDDEAIAEKEPTVASFGFDQSYIGNRLDLIIADDMVDKRVTRNPEVMLAQREIWDTETETRLEPGGLLLLIGQRLAADDLYHYCLSQRIPLDPDELEELDVPEAPQRYHHIVYPAHDDERCAGVHKRTEAEPWPAGCLLDPGRLPWRELLNQQARNPDRYEVVYQQRDIAPGSTLVHPAWIHGGVDHMGDTFAGSWDLDRGVWQRPTHLHGPTTGIVTVDPSSTRYWAVHAWLYDQPEDEKAALDLAGNRYLLDLRNLRMEAPELLGYNLQSREFYGILEEWHAAYKAIGQKLDVVIVEHNHAQRFLLQYDHAKEWSRLRGVQFVPHTTSQIKLDPEIGVTSISVHWKFGRVRLPGRTDVDRAHVEPLVKQVTTYPRASLDDQVMANWFMEVQLPNVVKRVRRERPPEGRNRRPSWLVGARR